MLCTMNEIDETELSAVHPAMHDVEVMLVGAGIGGGFEHTSELKTRKATSI